MSGKTNLSDPGCVPVLVRMLKTKMVMKAEETKGRVRSSEEVEGGEDKIIG
jgi:hypothetical protein